MKRIKKIIYLGGIYSFGNLLEKGMAFFFIPIYTLYLGTADYGIIGLMSVTVGLTSKLFYPPVNQGFLRHYYSPEYEDKKGLLLFNCLLFILVQALIFSTLFYLLSKPLAVLILKDEGLVDIVNIYALILFFDPTANFLLNYLKQREQAKLTILISWAHSLFYAAIAISGLILLDLGVFALIYAILFGAIFKFICIFPFFWKESTHKVSFSVLKEPLKYGYPRIIGACSSLLMESGDRYVLVMYSALSSVGMYSFGSQISAAISILIVTPLTTALLPSVYQQENNPEKQKEFLKRTCTYFYVFGVFACLGLSLFSKEIISLLAQREEFWGSWVVVPVLAYSYILVGLGSFFDWGLVMTKSGMRLSLNVVIAAVVNIGLNFLLVPFWGIMGAAIATLISYVVLNALRIFYSAKLYGLKFELGRLGHISLLATVLYLLAILFGNTPSTIFNIAVKTIVLLTYPLYIYLSGFLHAYEKLFVQKTWNNIQIDGLKNTFAKVRAIN